MCALHPPPRRHLSVQHPPRGFLVLYLELQVLEGPAGGVGGRRGGSGLRVPAGAVPGPRLGRRVCGAQVEQGVCCGLLNDS